MATIPSFTTTPQIDVAAISTANTNRDGTGTIGAIVTGAAATNYLKVSAIVVKAVATSAAGTVRFYISVDAGATWKLLHEMIVTAITASASLPAFEDIWYCPSDLILPSASYKIGASTEKSETFNLTALSAKF